MWRRARSRPSRVAPLAGAWIETVVRVPEALPHMSRPSRARGLKQFDDCDWPEKRQVAPLAGAWIETNCSPIFVNRADVAPLAGAWIETPVDIRGMFGIEKSRPSRARGLKPYSRLSE